jgi:predicted DNA-binding transcriptional regulator AlpA
MVWSAGTAPIEQSVALGIDRSPRDARGFTLHQVQIDPQMSPYMRVLSFGDLKCLKHIGWNEEYIAQLVGAGLFPAPIHPGGWRESQIDDWLKARKAKGDLSWMRFSLKDIAGPIARVGKSAGRRT